MMNSSIETGKPKVGYIGDRAVAVAHEWDKLADVSELAEGQQPGGLDMILIDCESAGESSVGVERLTELLRSGVTLAVANPADDTLQRLRAITGIAPDESVALAVYSHIPESDPPAYHLTTVPVARQSDLVAVGTPDDATAEPLRASGEGDGTETQPVAVDWDYAFSSVQESSIPATARGFDAGHRGGERPEPLLAGGLGEVAGNFLNPPEGAFFGYQTSSNSFSAVLGPPGCDRRSQVYGNPTQTFSGLLNNEYFVYWADGEQKPYYLLVHKQTGSINPVAAGRSPRRTLTWEGESKGYMMTQLDFQYFSLRLPEGASARLTGRGPTMPMQNSTAYQIQIPVGLRAMKAGSRMPHYFTADSGPQSISFPGWAVRENTNPTTGTTAWTFYQVEGWDRSARPWNKFGEWWSQIYYKNDWVKYAEDVNEKYFAEQSSGIFNYVLMNAWRIDCNYKQEGSKAVPPPALSVNLDYKVVVDATLFHNCNGCTSGSHHLFMSWNDWRGSDQLQLDKIVRII